MNWANIIKRILGKFWVNIFKDSWLCLFIVKVFLNSVGKSLDRRLQTIKNQLSIKCTDLRDYCISERILILAKSTSAVVNIADIVISLDGVIPSIGAERDGNTYRRINKRDIPEKIKRSVTDSLFLSLGKLYVVYDEAILFIKPLLLLGFTKKLVTIDQNLILCYLLWGYDYVKYNTIRDSFSSILNLPITWYNKYPGSILTAWDIKMNGATKKHIKNFIDSISYDKLDSCVLDYKDVLSPLKIPFIDVITDIGVFKAINSTRDSINIKDTLHNILPLLCSQTELKLAYIKLCKERSKDLKIPYIHIPDSVNPVNFLVKLVWKSSFIFILTYCSNKEDAQKAALFISMNIPKTVSLFIYNIENYSHLNSFYRIFPILNIEAKLKRYTNTADKYFLTKQS